MLHPDVVSLRQFYSSSLGLCVRRDVGKAIMRFWHDTPSSSVVLGLGFALPYLRAHLERSHAVLSVMFPDLGAMYWPADADNRTVLAKECDLPLQDNSAGRVLVCHVTEYSAHLTTLMNEIYRVLQPGGRALIIVPNRLGQWTRNAKTPFGSGHPYQISQMRHRAELAGLTYVRASTALFYGPLHWRIILKLSRAIEWIGRFLLPNFGGVLLVEVEKQIYASIPEKGKKIPIMPILYPQASPAPSSSVQSKSIAQRIKKIFSL